MHELSTDVALVGAGPIGIEMAVALRRAGIDYVHFDARQIGYTISWFAPQARFFSSNERIAIAGVPLQSVDQGKSTREEYLRYLRTVVELMDLTINTYEPVTAIERTPDQAFTITTIRAGAERRTRAKRVILATGGTTHPRRLGVPGEDLPHVSHYFQDPHTYFRKRVLIVGGKNSAVEAALRCYHAGARVAMSYRRDQLPEKSIKYWLLPEIKSLFESGRIESYFPTTVQRITPSHVTLRDDAGKTRDVPADFVLALIGYVADMSLCRMAGVELRGDCQAPVFDERTMETNVPGLYVAGTVVGGTQDKYVLFLENCHVHVDRILAALTGAAPAAAPQVNTELET